MGEQGWSFEPGPGVVPDPVLGARYLHELYTSADPSYTGRVTVPVLWDLERRTIVSNESADILRMLNAALDEAGARPVDGAPGDLWSDALRADIEAVNARVYATVNNGVYRAGFATTQEAYEEAVTALFATLDWLEQRLSDRRYLLGDEPTEADVRLFTTLVRSDAVYHGHFKCNLRRIVDYPALWRCTRDVHGWPGVAETVEFQPHQAALLSEPPGDQPEPDRAAVRAGFYG